jgi:predicted metal-dependent phosphoesterase TrpH
MSGSGCWVIEEGAFRRSPGRVASGSSLVCLHTHSCFSHENLASLNWVAQLSYMRPFRHLLQRSFGLDRISDVDYRRLHYRPPFRPDRIWQMETDNAASLGYSRLLLAITDHDEVAGGRELYNSRPHEAGQIGLGEELTFRFEHEVFHLGITGLAGERLEDVHQALGEAARADRLDDVFELLASTGCLVVLNHPLLGWGAGHQDGAIVPRLLERYGWAVDALEFNAMRSQSENRRVVELAQRVHKPLVGGGDSHLLLASSAACATAATTYADFVAEVKSGRSRPILRREYFAPQRWKIALRVLSFIAQYRTIADYDGVPVNRLLDGRRVLLDPIGKASGWLLAAADRLGCLA